MRHPVWTRTPLAPALALAVATRSHKRSLARRVALHCGERRAMAQAGAEAPSALAEWSGELRRSRRASMDADGPARCWANCSLRRHALSLGVFGSSERAFPRRADGEPVGDADERLDAFPPSLALPPLTCRRPTRWAEALAKNRSMRLYPMQRCVSAFACGLACDVGEATACGSDDRPVA